MALVRHPSNPVLSAKDIPFDASLIFNAGVCKFNGRYVMVFRNDVGFGPNGYGKTYTNLGIAYSDDGVKWEVQPRPWKVAADIVAAMKQEIAAEGGQVDYVEALDADTLAAPTEATGAILLAVAVYFGTTRLIDNELVQVK